MIINYKELLYAIFNSDPYSENGQEFPIIVYDILNSGLPVAVFKNASTCAKFFNTTPNVIKCTICRNSLKRNRYKLERVKLDERI